MSNRNAFKNAQWDKDNSTFYRKILLMGKPELIGYSKKMGMDERNDKIALLINWIIRDYEAGYLDPDNPRVDRIEKLEYFEKSNDRHLFNLHYTYPEYVDPHFLDDPLFRPLVHFLVQFYQLREENVPSFEIRRQLYIKGRSRPKEDPLDITKRRFHRLEDLRNYAADLILKNTAEPGAIENFIIKYSEKWFGMTPTVKRSGETKQVGELILKKYAHTNKKRPGN